MKKPNTSKIKSAAASFGRGSLLVLEAMADASASARIEAEKDAALKKAVADKYGDDAQFIVINKNSHL